jgi:signal recognition particle subunit SRP54
VFDSLAEKLQATLADVRGRGTLTEADITAAMREIRLALLEADVNFKVVKSFTNAVKERALGSDIIGQLNPGQQVVKIVSDELTELMGGSGRELSFSPRPPTIVLMAGLQGSGKTTATAKLARYLREQHNSSVAVAACDVYRPAAVEQLIKVGQQAGADVYEQGTDRNPVQIAWWAADRAQSEGKDVLIIDTSGRLHIDEELMKELADIKKAVRPTDILLVVDAMTGQDAVNVAEQFAEVVDFDGVVMSKLDGDARGGAALSVREVTGVPILFASAGEKLEDFDIFHPDRMASRILGMGDVLTLIEQAEQVFDAQQAEAAAAKIGTGELTLEDFLEQMLAIRKMGPIGNLLGMLPGAGQMKEALAAVDDKHLDRVQAIIRGMTPAERADPKIINASRRLRIANGSGVTVSEVNQLVDRFFEARKMMSHMAGQMGMPFARKSSRKAKGGKGKKGKKGARGPRPPKVRGPLGAGMPAATRASRHRPVKAELPEELIR